MEQRIFKLKRWRLFGPMVYIAYKNDFVLYVGFSSIGLVRPLSHWFIKQISHLEIRRFITKEEALNCERELIEEHNPPYNTLLRFKNGTIEFCKICLKQLVGRSDKAFCSDACRQRNARNKREVYKIPKEYREMYNALLKKKN